MNNPEDEKPVEKRLLKRYQYLPCDGIIYQDEHGEWWFGIPCKIRGRKEYLRLLKIIAWLKKRRQRGEDSK